MKPSFNNKIDTFSNLNREKVETITNILWKKFYNPNKEHYPEEYYQYGMKPSKVRFQFALEGYIGAYGKNGKINVWCDLKESNPHYEMTKEYWIMLMCRELNIPMRYESAIKEKKNTSPVSKVDKVVTKVVKDVYFNDEKKKSPRRRTKIT